jgi:hypothetical protein
MAMERNKGLTSEERARITEIQDLLIDRYVERKDALEKRDYMRAKEVESEIKDLLHEKEDIEERMAV